ncbi:uncharacterized protein MELLADRAFT_69955 [Melampsora larici-populina 98AG31]|uniref:Amino acid permease/ SLC12A domain-containing protein n=1 Tax=Melampsora larici-populina (strain 98AG31 / pathotype 3-4-7) TaxID=747676 RepID=F4SCX4_MELLP|nr:uncharacterized protein MELLADRAFT_69955 [Melampsora larici-populina 98AG31]EGF97503.1 hypothetical protein MELLADRAFT_69955 [Melampsora larici-populina 98AG31]
MSVNLEEKGSKIITNEKEDVHDPNYQDEGHHQGEGNVKRNLKQRHISMIAIGGTIGTGLFLGSGEALSNGGPVGLILGYAIMGVVVYSMMVALGEMVTMFPVSGAFTHYATRFVDPALGFAVGFNYWRVFSN